MHLSLFGHVVNFLFYSKSAPCLKRKEKEIVMMKTTKIGGISTTTIGTYLAQMALKFVSPKSTLFTPLNMYSLEGRRDLYLRQLHSTTLDSLCRALSPVASAQGCDGCLGFPALEDLPRAD
jgi:hypothetical protein